MIRNVIKDFLRKDVHFRNLVMEIPVSVMVLRGPDFKIEFINNRLLKALQKTWHEVDDRPFFQIFPELIVQGYEKFFRQVYETGRSFSKEVVPLHLWSSDDFQYIKLSVQPLINPLGHVTGLFIVASDVTELVKSRHQIAESELKYRSVLELMDPGFSFMELIFKDGKPVDYIILEVNPAFEKMLGSTELVGKSINELMPDIAEFWINLFGKVALTGEKVTTVYDMPELDKTFESHAFRIGGNESRRVAVLINDITERMKNDQLREQFSRKLEQQVAQRTRELEQSNSDLKQFTHLISHDLKEPVRKLKFLTSMLSDELQDTITTSQATYIHKILSATERLRKMIEAIYDYSFADFNEEKVRDTDLSKLINVLVEDLDHDLKAHEAEVIVHPLPVIRGITIEFYQLFYNILSNSLKFSKPDVPCRIEISSRIVTDNGRQFAEISVTDNGIGFDPCFEEKIFQSFTRLHSKDEYEGTGLGLSLSRKIVHRHGGTIKAYGEVGKGATITVKLPYTGR
ncbi:MAG TPA: ATP-binding protein [Lentimicrobium sp.]|nr:ATP-binding protein [Lentimicrobium sp.]